MSLQQFTLVSLKELDAGRAALAFEQHVRRAALDCLDRPADPTARKVVLEITLSPVLEPGGECTEVRAQIHASSAVPKHKTKAYSFGLKRNGMLTFNPDSTDAVDQTTLLPDEDN